MKTNKIFQKIILAGILINLLSSSGIILAQTARQTADINISDCTINCLNLSTPDEITLNDVHFLSPESGVVYIASNPAVGSEITINDAKGSGGFSLDANITNLSNGTTSIPYTDIGFLTFSASTSSPVDGKYNPTISALNDAEYSYENFTRNTTTSVDPDDFIYFTGTDFTSEALIGIIQDDLSSTSRGSYTAGFALAIRTPENPEQLGLRDDNYNLNITFTLYPL
jgi:hypothetical protein